MHAVDQNSKPPISPLLQPPTQQSALSAAGQTDPRGAVATHNTTPALRLEETERPKSSC